MSNKNWSPSKLDVLKFTAVITCILFPFAYYRQYMWFMVLTGSVIVFLVFEFFIATKFTNRQSLSERFWNFKKKHPKGALLCLFGIVIFWTYIILHLWFEI